MQLISVLFEPQYRTIHIYSHSEEVELENCCTVLYSFCLAVLSLATLLFFLSDGKSLRNNR